MSFMGGSACATGANPLAQMAKQQSVDRSLQHEHLRGQASAPGMRGAAERQMSPQDQQLFQEMNGAAMRPGTFNYSEMRHELPRTQAPQAGPSTGPSAWASEFQQPQTRGATPPTTQFRGSQWSAEFDQPQFQGPVPGPSVQMNQAFSPRFAMGSAMGMAPMGMSQVPQTAQAQQAQIKELDADQWEAQFKQFEKPAEAETKTETETETAAEITTADVKGETFEAQPEQTVEDVLQEREIGVEDVEDYDESWLKSDMYPPGWDDLWNKIKGSVTDDAGFRTRSDPDSQFGKVWDRDFSNFAASRPDFGDYEFSKDNPYLQEDDPYAMGVALMDQGAKLSVAALCFEAALQKNPNHVEAWARLGDAQAQNEVEDVAIHALEKAVKLDPSNLKALMNLAISYTNEGYENAASATLERWLATKYPQLVSQAQATNPALANESRSNLHNRVTELFLQAAQLSPDGASMDADVQVGLGVLFYRNEDYSKAVDCFSAALSVRPDDALLWNRLGATLANASQPERAINAYYKALELRPSFVRARCNLGVSCINIGCYREAAEHLLSALSLHDTGNGDTLEHSNNLMETLRRVFLAMDRRDLLVKVNSSMNLDEFRPEFNF